jgi:hypothetical protein
VRWILTAAVVGVVLMVGFDSPLTRVLGLLCLFGFIVGGVFLIADPVALGSEEAPMPDERAP